MSTTSQDLFARANHQCELCSGTDLLAAFEVPSDTPREDTAILVCEICSPQLQDDADLDTNHWYCLQGSIWSEVSAVQVMSYRLLGRLQAETWARDLLGQAYLDEETLAWANEGDTSSAGDDQPETFDSNGARLHEGDSITLIRDLDVKGTSFTAKRGTLVKGIRLTGDPGYIEGKVNKIAIMLKTEFIKKA